MISLKTLLLNCFFILSLLILTGCSKNDPAPNQQQAPAKEQASGELPLMPLLHDSAKTAPLKKRESSVYDSNNPAELDFEVENLTGKTLFVTSFSYQRRRSFERWHWVKSPIYEVAPHQIVTVDIDTIGDESDRKSVFGYLAVLESHIDAEQAVIELLPDSKKLDLDQLIKLKGKRVALTVEKYGFKPDKLEFDFVEKTDSGTKKPVDELDFAVENKTGRPVFVTCFAYQKKAKGSWIGATEAKDDMSVWHYEKSPVIKIDADQTGIIDVGTIVTMRDRSYVRGYLAIFPEEQELMAHNATYELLSSTNKLNLGELARLAHKKIVLEVQNYGILQDYFDYVIKPVKNINFQAIHGPKKS